MICEDMQRNGLWLKTMGPREDRMITISYSKWNLMKQRCNPNGEVQKRAPTYVGCTMTDNFEDYQYFVNWHRAQIGYGTKYDLDKDLLVEGNKLYSEDRCVLIPHTLNSFLVNSAAIRGDCPQGVCWIAEKGRFDARMKINGKQVYLGRFDNPEDAARAYAQAKTEEARKWYRRLLNKEYIVDDRVIEKMRTWEFRQLPASYTKDLTPAQQVKSSFDIRLQYFRTHIDAVEENLESLKKNYQILLEESRQQQNLLNTFEGDEN